MKAWQITDEFGIENLELNDIPTPKLKSGEVLLKMTAASLNYRDLVTVSGGYGRTVSPPLIPCSDGVGQVVDRAEDANRYPIGSRLSPCFFPAWTDGPASPEGMPDALGGAFDGTLADYMVVHEEACVEAPASLTNVEVATLPCAALTAWSALFEHSTIQPGNTLVIQGTGGVALFALQLAKAAGAEVLITSSSDEKLETAQKMGADHLVNYRTTPDWSKAVKTIWPNGADHIIELGGAETLEQSIRATRIGGHISLIGVLSGTNCGNIPLPLILMRNICIQGITVGSREAFKRMNQFIDQHQIKPVVDKVFSFDEAPAAFHHLQEAKHFGKICVEF